MKKAIKDNKGNIMYHIDIEDVDFTGYCLASQVIRDIMFTKRTKRLRSIDEVYEYTQSRYSPQASPLGVRELVSNEYLTWIKHFIKMSKYLDNPKEQLAIWGTEDHFKHEDFYEMCPDLEATQKMHDDLDKLDAFENRSNAPF